MPTDPSMISAEAAAKVLCELFLTNADRGDNAANDHLVAEMVDRIRAQQDPGTATVAGAGVRGPV